MKTALHMSRCVFIIMLFLLDLFELCAASFPICVWFALLISDRYLDSFKPVVLMRMRDEELFLAEHSGHFVWPGLERLQESGKLLQPPPLSIPLSLTTVSTTEPSAATPRNSTLPSVKDHSWEEVSGGGLGVRAGGESVRLREGQLEYGKAAYVNVRRNRSKKKTGNLQKEKLNFRNFTATLKFQHFTHWLTAVKTILASGKGKLWKASWWLNCSIEMHFSELWSGQLEKENKPGFLQFHAMSTT